MSQDLPTHRHRFLVAGEIIFSQADSDTVHSVRLNTMIAHTDCNIPARLIGRAQQVLQVMLMERMRESAKTAGIALPQINVQDVVILNVSPLGWMSEAEFNAPPEGMALKQKAKDAAQAMADAAFADSNTAAPLHILTGAAE